MGGIPALIVIALEDISQNNEITGNYRALPRISGNKLTPCLCGAKTCIKFIEGEEAQKLVVEGMEMNSTDDEEEKEAQKTDEVSVNSSDEEEIEEGMENSNKKEDSLIEEVIENSVEEEIEENINVFTDEEVLKSIWGGIENNKNKKNIQSAILLLLFSFFFVVLTRRCFKIGLMP